MERHPDWVRSDPSRNVPRLSQEIAMLRTYFPGFRFMVEEPGECLFVEGTLRTNSNNRYIVRGYYPPTYPYDPPNMTVCDADVVAHCSIRGMHDWHHLGTKNGKELQLCLLKRSNGLEDGGWVPKQTMVAAILRTSAWLHAYEVKRVTGEWILRTA